jgi:phosphatidylinositol glycan class K
MKTKRSSLCVWQVGLFVVAVCYLTTFVAAGGHDKRLHPLPIRPGKLDAHPSNHTDQWAVIVATSRFWHNYRHTTNALEVYRMLRDSGLPDSHIVLMLADDIACEPRNAFPTVVHGTYDLRANVMCADVEVDFAGDSVTAINFLRVLTGRMPAGTPSRQQIFPGPTSNVLVYMTGHSGAHFMKFHDYDFMTSYDVADAINAMHRAQRYHRLLFVVDTCQAETIFTHISAPNVVSIASSREHQNSISHPHHHAAEIGNALVDGFTSEWFREFFAQFGGGQPGHVVVDPFSFVHVPSDVGLIQFFGILDPRVTQSEYVWSHERDAEGFAVLAAHWKVRDFFGPGLRRIPGSTAGHDAATLSGWTLLS